jgi:hypothetical protein
MPAIVNLPRESDRRRVPQGGRKVARCDVLSEDLNMKQLPLSVRADRDGRGWMLVPSLTLGCLGIYAYIGLFIGARFGDLSEHENVGIGLIVAAGASLCLGACASRHLIDRRNGGLRSPVLWMIDLIVGGILCLLVLDTYALWRF